MQPGSNTGSAPEATRHIPRCRHGMSRRDAHEASFRAIMRHDNDHDLRMQHPYHIYAKREHYVALCCFRKRTKSNSTISGCGDEPSVRIAAEAPSGSRTMAAVISGRSSRENRDDHQELPAAVVQFPSLPS